MKKYNISFEVIEYLKNPPSKEEILILAKKLDKHPSEFVRKKEKEFIENRLSELLNDENALANAISRFPKILERPILVSGAKAIIGRPREEKILKLIL